MKHSRRKYAGDREAVIEVVYSGNPKRPGTKAYERFEQYRNGMTVGEYEKACEDTPRAEDALIDITWDESHGFIRLDPRR
jgi:hypothetical protein